MNTITACQVVKYGHVVKTLFQQRTRISIEVRTVPSGYYSRPFRPAIFPVGPSIAYIALSQDQFSLVDWDDAVRFGRHNWSAQYDAHTKGFYAFRQSTKKEGCSDRRRITLHREICPTHLQVDHINRVTLDNRRANLRPVDVAQNVWNAGPICTNTSGVKGVNWNKRSGQWHAQIMYRRKKYHLGYFRDFDLAIAARQNAEKIRVEIG